ncbi:hypothetical protein MEQU1_001894 [Malassezia equina]|uniref:Exonuclease 1 n=1 Tax=Malassezia equina TaxID=1381935 RepID=A0AAF0EI97_9BASI|nr:hypothetical protein MEQU1_001894 [Malassezia equina]
MGIQGLLPLLKDIQKDTHVEAFRGRTLGIDGYVWLHRGAYACAMDLALGRPTTRYITYAMHRIRMLQHYGVKPYVVFDGGPLPSKAGTESERESRRAEHRQRGLALYAQKRVSEARDAFVRSIDITPQMAHELIKVLRSHGIPYLVAPYEADAQLAFLEQSGVIDGIISEDSDLLVFGCRHVLFKMDTYGHCVEIQRAHLSQVTQPSFAGWGDREFRHMAILSGCDYLPSIAGMGLRSAHRLLRKYASVERLLQALRLEGKWQVPATYADAFVRADFTFLHQRVWDPRGDGAMSTLHPLPKDVEPELLACIGAPLADDVARAIACGDVCPITRRRFTDVLQPRAPAAALTPTPPAQPTLRAFFRAAPSPSPSSRDARADSSCSTVDSLFDTTDALADSPCTSPSSHASEGAAVCVKAEAPASPLTSPHVSEPSTPEHLGAPASSQPPASELDAGVSSPVSSPPGSPMAAAAAQRPLRTPATARHALVWTPNQTDSEQDDRTRRHNWFQRFQFASATRPRHSVLPGTSPSPATSTAGSTPRLPLGKRAAPEATPTPPKRVAPTPPSHGSGREKLLLFQYRHP